MSDRGGGSLNNRYSIINPWTLNPETQTYNTIEALMVKGAGGDVRQGGLGGLDKTLVSVSE